MKLKSGYTYSDYFNETYNVVEKDGEAEINIEINGLETESNFGGGYGATVHMEDGKIVAFTIRSYDIEVKIPATIEMHDKIKALLR